MAGFEAKSRGTVFAFDLDPERLEILKKTARRAGAKNVRAVCSDFLKVDPNDPKFSRVRAILLDPSCSGSGTVFYKDTTRTIESLTELQLSVILHALKFPKVERVVYSTCSIHQEENEDVVLKALQQSEDKQWQLAPAVPQWHRRGFDVFPGSDKCLRTSPTEDNTIGFFVACFQRAKPE